MIVKRELLNAIEEKYGDLDNECGCYVWETGEWLSIADIVEIINSIDEY